MWAFVQSLSGNRAGRVTHKNIRPFFRAGCVNFLLHGDRVKEVRLGPVKERWIGQPVLDNLVNTTPDAVRIRVELGFCHRLHKNAHFWEYPAISTRPEH
jgi:hypothetical protein